MIRLNGVEKWRVFVFIEFITHLRYFLLSSCYIKIFYFELRAICTYYIYVVAIKADPYNIYQTQIQV